MTPSYDRVFLSRGGEAQQRRLMYGIKVVSGATIVSDGEERGTESVKERKTDEQLDIERQRK